MKVAYTGERSRAYLAFGVSKLADYGSTVATWNALRDGVRGTFARQALPMTWDFAEVSPLGRTGGSFVSGIAASAEVIERLPSGQPGTASQADAASGSVAGLVATDPPYYDNIGYADLSDFFYVWLRQNLREVYPELLGTVLSPKAQELVATPTDSVVARVKRTSTSRTGSSGHLSASVPDI